MLFEAADSFFQHSQSDLFVLQTPENLITFFSQAGEVKYVRMAGDESAGVRAAYLEMTDQRSIPTCLGYNGVNFNGRVITLVFF